MVKHLKENDYEEIAKQVGWNKALLIQFLKTNNWTSQDMSQNWFVHIYDYFCYGRKTVDNLLTPNSHCACITSSG